MGSTSDDEVPLEFKFTDLDESLFDDAGATKRDLAEYLEAGARPDPARTRAGPA